MKPCREEALTITELLVALVVIFMLLSLFVLSHIPPTHVMVQGQMTQMLSNMKQLQAATEAMVVDGPPFGETNMQWPGDCGGSFTNWIQQIAPSYLRTSDLCKLLSGPGLAVSTNQLPTANTNAVLVYAVKALSPEKTVFLTSANFTNTPEGGQAPGEKNRLFGTNGFVVFHRDGSGAILKISTAGKTNAVGGFVPLCR